MTNRGAESDDHRDETDPKFVEDNGHPHMTGMAFLYLYVWNFCRRLTLIGKFLLLVQNEIKEFVEVNTIYIFELENWDFKVVMKNAPPTLWRF